MIIILLQPYPSPATELYYDCVDCVLAIDISQYFHWLLDLRI